MTIIVIRSPSTEIWHPECGFIPPHVATHRPPQRMGSDDNNFPPGKLGCSGYGSMLCWMWELMKLLMQHLQQRFQLSRAAASRAGLKNEQRTEGLNTLSYSKGCNTYSVLQ